MLSEFGRRPMLGGNEGSFGSELEKEMGMLLREQRRQEAVDRERELNLYRSDSAPPTIDGSLNAVGGLFGGSYGGDDINHVEFPAANNGNGFLSEEELRSDPAYLSYYYSNVNLNPRLPPPLLSKEDWRFAQRLKGGSSALGGIGDTRKVNRVNDGAGRSLLPMPPGFNSKRQEIESQLDKSIGSTEWRADDGLIGLDLGLGSKQKNLAGICQDDLSQSTPVARLPSRPASHNMLDENVSLNESDLVNLGNGLDSSGLFSSAVNGQGSSSGQSISQPSSHTYAAALGSFLSRSNTPDPQLVARAPSPCLTPIGGVRGAKVEKRSVANPNSFSGVSSNASEPVDVIAALSGMNLSTNSLIDDENHLSSKLVHDVDNYQSYLFGVKGDQDGIEQTSFGKKSESGRVLRSSASQAVKASYSDLGKSNGGASDLKTSSKGRHFDVNQSSVSSVNSYLKGSPTSTLNGGGQYQNFDEHGTGASFFNYGSTGHSINPTLALGMTGQLAAASAFGSPGLDSSVLGGLASGPNQAAVFSESHNAGRLGSLPIANSLQAPFTDPVYLHYLRTLDYTVNDPSTDQNYASNSYLNMLELQKAYVGALLSPQKSQYGLSFGGKSTGSNHHGYYGNPAFGLGLHYPGSPILSNSSVGFGSPMRQNELNTLFASGMGNLGGGIMGPWHQNSGCNMDGSFASSLLEEFKSNKTKCFELSEISGHVVEFSADQYGSRFIQQKLETATTDEKNMVYREIMPQALALMTDVFGNYVIQKFFEHGLPSQRRELGDTLIGHVLNLSLQMYGCRVIQKAIEVVDLDQKIRMVEELDGNVMRCVRDQNGNHVIQKCIECVPEEAIHFLVSTFFDQVVSLSTHPYGCRVMQRVLEHCQDPKTQNKVMDEILEAVSMLAQDQYGNYVVQHVLEHGRPHERTAIIKELAGKIVQMSQQKFASNVVEKCLTFGGPAERQLLVNQMLGTTDENEPLQAMMKDQFANYVVQKVLETCDDQQRELILTRIKVHLSALKKYTYGKHIVARVEKLVAAGEKKLVEERESLSKLSLGVLQKGQQCQIGNGEALPELISILNDLQKGGWVSA